MHDLESPQDYIKRVVAAYESDKFCGGEAWGLLGKVVTSENWNELKGMIPDSLHRHFEGPDADGFSDRPY